MKENTLGKVIGGSVNKGVKAYLEDSESIEHYPIGALITIKGQEHKYLALIVDAGITSSEDVIGNLMGSNIPQYIRNIVTKACESTVRRQWVELALVAQATSGNDARSADTMPSFYSNLTETRAEEIEAFFGHEDQEKKWNIGIPKTPKRVSVEIPVDVEKLVELSFGIFGKSGTGKTFLGNILAGYIVLYDLMLRKTSPTSKRIKMLIFDMHSEYALELKDNMGNVIADGAAKIFSNIFKKYTPDEELAKNRGLELLKINYNELSIDDFRLIAPIFGVSETFLNHLPKYASIIRKKIKLNEYWVWGLLLDEYTEEELRRNDEGKLVLKNVLEKAGVRNAEQLREKIIKIIREKLGHGPEQAFISQTSKLKRMLRYPYTCHEDIISDIVDNLLSDEGYNITISLGKFEKETPLYMIIANLIAKRLRQKIIEKSEKGEELRTKIVIFLEEAHNFLSRDAYMQSPFGDVAREMRKKGVILCVIDQRPSELDPDVISMLWTNFVFALTNRNDIEAALLGAPKVELFKKVIPILSKREVLVYGEAIRFPIIIKVKDYRNVAGLFSEITFNLRRENKVIEESLREQGLL